MLNETAQISVTQTAPGARTGFGAGFCPGGVMAKAECLAGKIWIGGDINPSGRIAKKSFGSMGMVSNIGVARSVRQVGRALAVLLCWGAGAAAIGLLTTKGDVGG